MRFDVLTLFPDFFASPLDASVIGKAIGKGLIDVGVTNIRDYASDRHRTTDDYPYGGGAGMVMKAEPAVAAIEAVSAAAGPDAPVILTTPQGVPYTQRLARELALSRRLVIFCGRYEGYDERIREFVDLEVSVGDYILSGGEAAALVIIDSVSRLVPGVLGSTESPLRDSFSDGLLEHPHYTRPEEFRGMRVPDVLLSGNHASVDRWRRLESIKRTFQRRPALLDAAHLTEEERRFVEGLKDSAEEKG